MVAKNALSIRSASQLLAKSVPQKEGQTTQQVLPTARARAAIDYLAGMNPEALSLGQVNLKPIVNDLFNWTGTPKGTRTVLRALMQAINTPGKYPQAVELTAFLSSLAGVLEADVLARMFTLINTAENAYAPNRYLIQRSGRMKAFADQFSPERKERILSSMWTEVHRGRWWDISSGDAQHHWNIPEDDETPVEERLNQFRDGSLTLTKEHIKFLNEYPQRQVIQEYVDAHNLSMAQGKTIEPDIPVLISFIQDLAPLDRAEIPFEILLDRLDEVYETFDTLRRPHRPDTFLDLFPALALYGDAEVFNYPREVLRTHRQKVQVNAELIELILIENSASLGENRTFMGNCTWGLQSRMKAGTCILYRIEYKDGYYNIAFNLRENAWTLQEVNSRFNRGNVPDEIRELATLIPQRLLTTEVAQRAALQDQIRESMAGARKFKYRI